MAVDEEISVSAWVSQLIEDSLSRKDGYEESRAGAVRELQALYRLGGSPMGRDELHERS